MNRLPHWVLSDKNPGFYDLESATAIEQTAKLYKAMQTLIDEYNTFVDRINANIEEFENSTNQDYELFKTGLRQEFQDFIDTIELKVLSQDKAISDKFTEIDEKLNNAIKYMKASLRSTIETLLDEMKSSGEFTEIIQPIVIEVINDVIKPNGVHTEYDLLWENPDASIDFPAQNIELGANIMSLYDEFLLTYKYSIENEVDQQWEILRFRPNVQGEFVTGTSGGYVTDLLDFAKIDGDVVPFKRQIATNESKTMFVFLDCRAGYDVIEYENTYLIPCKIYGIKRFAYTDDIKNALAEIDSLIGGN